MRGAHVALGLLVLAAGCLAPGASTDDEPAAWAGARASFLHSAMTLAAAPEGNVSAVRTGGFFEAWAAGEDYPTWVADPLPGHARVTSATVTLYVQASGPVVESARFPDIMVYGGAGDAWMGFGSRTDLNAILPGDVLELDVELAMPEGGLWLAPDVGFGLKVVPVMLQQDDTADVEILLGGDTPSSVAWTVEPIDVPDARPESGSSTGEVMGTIYAGPAAPPTTSDRIPLAVPADAVWILAWMNTTDNVGIPDIDLGIEAPDGTPIATSGTPTPREAIRVAGANLPAAGEYQLVVTTAGSPKATVQVEWLIGRTA